jgi:hypothetical protein
MKAKVDYKDSDDGRFWIAFEDFVQHFESLYICRIFDSSFKCHRAQGEDWIP